MWDIDANNAKKDLKLVSIVIGLNLVWDIDANNAKIDLKLVSIVTYWVKFGVRHWCKQRQERPQTSKYCYLLG